MSGKKSGKPAANLEAIIGRVLQAGVIAGACVILVGLALFLATGDSGYPGNTFPSSLGAVAEGLPALKPYSIMLFGLLLLILTPVLRVGVSILIFIREKDRLYAGIAAAVLIILIASFILGKAG
jgi:uncharacterized membrane protein